MFSVRSQRADADADDRPTGTGRPLAFVGDPEYNPHATARAARGGRRIFPEHRLVGFSGGRGDSFGRLGIGDIDERAAEIDKLAAQYVPDGRIPLPIFELITVVAHASPTRTGLYRTHEPGEVVDQFLSAARRHRALLLLNIQPGRADFLDDVKTFEEWLL